MKIFLVIFLSLLVTSCGGGGGSSKPTTGSYISAPCGNSEQNCQKGYTIHNVASVNAAGYTGAGVRVGVVDTGIDNSHGEFDSKTINGHDFAVSSSGHRRDEHGHGTHVASIIAADRDGWGMRGLAYDADLYSYKMDNDGDLGFEAANSETTLTNLYNMHVTHDIDVSNNSWGSSSTSGTIDRVSEANIRSYHSNTITAMRNAQANGTLFVWAAGNLGHSVIQPDYLAAMPYRINELQNEWLLVVSVDEDKVETDYTQRCGLAWNFCVAAFGGDDDVSNRGVYGAHSNQSIYASDQGSYVRQSGTSMAAPQVSGIAANLMQKFPSLTPAQIATRIKTTATMTGLRNSAGVLMTTRSTSYQRSVFGNGLVSASAAGSMIGTPQYPRGKDYYEGVIELEKNKLNLPIWLSSGATTEILNSNFTVFDSFDGARFDVPGSIIFETPKKLSSSQSFSSFLEQKNESTGIELSILELDDHTSLSFLQSRKASPSSDFFGAQENLFLTNKTFKPNSTLGLKFNSRYDYLGSASFLEFAEDTQEFIVGSQLSINSKEADFRMMAGFDVTKNRISTGLESDRSEILEARGLHFGLQQKIGQSWSLFAKGSHRRLSDIAYSNNQWGLSDAKLTHYAVGLKFDNSITKFILGSQEPEEITSGRLSLNSPSGRSRNGQIEWETRNFNFERTGHKPLFAFFGTEFGQGSSLSISIHEDVEEEGQLGDIKLGYSMQF